jgi:hypothetical protein
MAADSFTHLPTEQLRERITSYSGVARLATSTGYPLAASTAHEEINYMLDELQRRGEVACPPS